jgi:hypothetical protein
MAEEPDGGGGPECVAREPIDTHQAARICRAQIEAWRRLFEPMWPFVAAHAAAGTPADDPQFIAERAARLQVLAKEGIATLYSLNVIGRQVWDGFQPGSLYDFWRFLQLWLAEPMPYVFLNAQARYHEAASEVQVLGSKAGLQLMRRLGPVERREDAIRQYRLGDMKLDAIVRRIKEAAEAEGWEPLGRTKVAELIVEMEADGRLPKRGAKDSE